jgi:hypothetical protein
VAFENDSVFVDCINQEGSSDFANVISMSVTNVNAVHMVESNGWTFKERPH